MASKSPKLNEKLRLLMGGRLKSEVASAAGIKPTTLSMYLGSTTPPAPVALRLAKVLGVDPIWLIDENEEIEERSVDGEVLREWRCGGAYAVKLVSTETLIHELEHRYRPVAIRARDIIEQAEKIDWAHARDELVRATFVSVAPPDVQAACDVAVELQHFLICVEHRFNPKVLRGYVPRSDDIEPNPHSTALDALSARVQRVLRSLTSDEVAKTAFSGYLFHPDRATRVLDPEDAIELAHKAIDHYREAGGKFIDS